MSLESTNQRGINTQQPSLLVKRTAESRIQSQEIEPESPRPSKVLAIQVSSTSSVASTDLADVISDSSVSMANFNNVKAFRFPVANDLSTKDVSSSDMQIEEPNPSEASASELSQPEEPRKIFTARRSTRSLPQVNLETSLGPSVYRQFNSISENISSLDQRLKTLREDISISPDAKMVELEKLKDESDDLISLSGKFSKDLSSYDIRAVSLVNTRLNNIYSIKTDINISIDEIKPFLSTAPDPMFIQIMGKIDSEYSGNDREKQSAFVNDLAKLKHGIPSETTSKLSAMGITEQNVQTHINDFVGFLKNGNNTDILKDRVRDGQKHEQVPTARIADIMEKTLTLPKEEAFSSTHDGKFFSRMDVLDKTLTFTRNVNFKNTTSTEEGLIVDHHPSNRYSGDDEDSKKIGSTHSKYDKELQDASRTSKNPAELLDKIIDINEKYLIEPTTIKGMLTANGFIPNLEVRVGVGDQNEIRLKLADQDNHDSITRVFTMGYVETMGSLYKFREDATGAFRDGEQTVSDLNDKIKQDRLRPPLLRRNSIDIIETHKADLERLTRP